MGVEGESSQQQPCLVQISSGVVTVTGPVEESKGATIAPGEGVLLWINGRQIDGNHRVYPGDEIKVEGLREREEARVELRLSADEMSAEAIYRPPRNIYYEISEHPPVEELTIPATRKEEISGPDLEPGQIKKILADGGVIHGIKEPAILELINEAGHWREVAAGTPPVQGRDGSVEYLIKEGLQPVSYNGEEGQVDYKRRYKIPQVNKGQLIAKIHPPRPGKPGLTVSGRELLPEPVSPAKVRCEVGTAFNGEGTGVVATRNGVPTSRRGREILFRVDDIYLHRGDIDIKTGHADFSGHLKISGGIAEGMRVKADGNIEIAGHTSGAEITAGGGIIINRNCIQCLVRAGWLSYQLHKINQCYDELVLNTGSLLEMGRELISVLEERGSSSDFQVSFLLRSLMQKKFPGLPELSAEILGLGQELAQELPASLLPVLENCNSLLKDAGFLLTWDLLEAAHRELAEQRALLKYTAPETAGISVYYVQNSKLICPGDIEIGGPGAYNSVLECEGRVRVTRIFRGGSIKAGGDIYIGEAGIPRLAKGQGLIETGSDGEVKVEKIYENTRIKIGKPEIYLERDLKRVRFYLNEEGEIKLGGFQ